MFSSNSTTTCLIGVVVRTGDSAADRDAVPLLPVPQAARASVPAATAAAAITAGLRLLHLPGPILPPEGYEAPGLAREARGPRRSSGITSEQNDKRPEFRWRARKQAPIRT